MPPNDDWLGSLLLSQIGRIWWLNFTFDEACGNLLEDTINRFYDRIEFNLSPPVLKDPLALIEYAVSNPPFDFDLVGSRSPRTQEALSTILTASTITAYHINLPRIGLELDEGTQDLVWDWLGNVIKGEHYMGLLRSRRAFFWSTPTRNLESAQNGALPASSIRNFLGLQHVIKGQRILRIDIPMEKLSSKRIAAPTTLDAGASIVFCPSKDPGGYGWTMHLESLDVGAEEVVIEQIPFDGDYVLTKVGSVELDPPNIDWDKVENKRREREST
jgi:hypothetical protein